MGAAASPVGPLEQVTAEANIGTGGIPRRNHGTAGEGMEVRPSPPLVCATAGVKPEETPQGVEGERSHCAVGSSHVGDVPHLAVAVVRSVISAASLWAGQWQGVRHTLVPVREVRVPREPGLKQDRRREGLEGGLVPGETTGGGDGEKIAVARANAATRHRGPGRRGFRLAAGESAARRLEPR